MAKRASPSRTTEGASEAGPADPRPLRREVWLGALLVLVVVFGLRETEIWRPEVVLDGRHNIQIAEAAAWREGRLDLPERLWDTALQNNRVYSHFPILFTAIAWVLLPLCGGVPHGFMLFFLAVPIVLLAYVLFYRATASPLWGAVLAIGFVCGTSTWTVIHKSFMGGGAYYPNHVLATLGLLILLTEYYGRRRGWMCGLGLFVATMSRQLTAAFAIPLVWLVLRDQPPAQRRRQLITLAVVGVVVAGVPLAVNTLKFGSPLQTGYMPIYAGRTDSFAIDAHEHGLFSPYFVPRNLYYMNLGLPRLHRIEMAGRPEYHLVHNIKGTGIWWTTPLLLWLWFDFRRIWERPAARSLLAAAVLVFVGLMFFHTTGEEQRGYNRFALDFMPALLAVIAPTCFAGRRRWVSLAMVMWSVVYFRWLV